MGLRGYLNHLETSGEVAGHGDHLPPQLATEPPTRGAVSVEKLQTGAAWLMEALAQRDKQLDGLQQQLTAMRAELAAAIADRPTPGRPVSSREPIRPQQGEGDDGEGDGGVQSKLRASSKKDGGALAELRSAPQKPRESTRRVPDGGGKVAASRGGERRRTRRRKRRTRRKRTTRKQDGGTGRRRRGGKGGGGGRLVAAASAAAGGGRAGAIWMLQNTRDSSKASRAACVWPMATRCLILVLAIAGRPPERYTSFTVASSTSWLCCRRRPPRAARVKYARCRRRRHKARDRLSKRATARQRVRRLIASFGVAAQPRGRWCHHVWLAQPLQIGEASVMSSDLF